MKPKPREGQDWPKVGRVPAKSDPSFLGSDREGLLIRVTFPSRDFFFIPQNWIVTRSRHGPLTKPVSLSSLLISMETPGSCPTQAATVLCSPLLCFLEYPATHSSVIPSSPSAPAVRRQEGASVRCPLANWRDGLPHLGCRRTPCCSVSASPARGVYRALAAHLWPLCCDQLLKASEVEDPALELSPSQASWGHLCPPTRNPGLVDAPCVLGALAEAATVTSPCYAPGLDTMPEGDAKCGHFSAFPSGQVHPSSIPSHMDSCDTWSTRYV